MRNFGFSSHYVKDLRGRNHLLGKDGAYVQSAAMAIRYGMGKEDAKRLCAALNAGEVENEDGMYKAVKVDTGELPKGMDMYEAIETALFAAMRVAQKPAKPQEAQA